MITVTPGALGASILLSMVIGAVVWRYVFGVYLKRSQEEAARFELREVRALTREITKAHRELSDEVNAGVLILNLVQAKLHAADDAKQKGSLSSQYVSLATQVLSSQHAATVLEGIASRSRLFQVS